MKGALEERFIQTKGDQEMMLQSESNRNNIIIRLQCFPRRRLLSKTYLYKMFMIALRRPSFFVKAYTCIN